MGRAVSSLLIAALLSCPFVCGQGHPAKQAGGEVAETCGCCRHESSKSQGDDSCPVDPSQKNSGHSCQCICGGAVVDNAGSVHVDFDWNWSVPLVPVAVVAGQAAEVELRIVSIAPWPDVGMNHGRALCCLYNTFLC